MDGLKTPDPPSRKRFGAVGESKITRTQEWKWSPGTPSIGDGSSPSISVSVAKGMTPTVATPSGLSERKRRSGWASIAADAKRDEGSPICLSARKKGRKEGGASVEYHSQDETQTPSFPVRNDSCMLPPHSQIDSPYQKSIVGEDSFAKKMGGGGGDHPQQPVTPLMETSSSRLLRRRPVLKSSLVGLTISSPRSAIDSVRKAVGAFGGLTSGTPSKNGIEVEADGAEERGQDCDATADEDCVHVSMVGDAKEKQGLMNDPNQTLFVCEDVVDLRGSSDDDDEEVVEVVKNEEKDFVKETESSGAPGFVSEGVEGVSDRLLKGKGGDMVSAAGKAEGGGVLRSRGPSSKKGVGRRKGGKGSLIDNHFPPLTPTQRRKITPAALPSVRQGMITRRTNSFKVMSKKTTSNNLLNYYRLSKGVVSSAARGKRSDVTKESNTLHKHAASVVTEGTSASHQTRTEKHARVACSPTQLPAVTPNGCKDILQVQLQTKGNGRLPALHEGNGAVVPSLSQVAASQDPKLESPCDRPVRVEDRGGGGGSRRHVVSCMAKTIDTGNHHAVAVRGREGGDCQSLLRIPPSPFQRSIGGKAVPLTSVLRSSDRPAKSETISGTPGRRRVTFNLRHQDDSEAYSIDRVVIGSPTTTTSSCEVDGTYDAFDCLWTKEPKRIVEFLWQNDPVYRGMLCMGCEHQYTDELREHYLRTLTAESS